MTHAQRYMRQAAVAALSVDHDALDRLASALVALRNRGGRLFLLGSTDACNVALRELRQQAGIEASCAGDWQVGDAAPEDALLLLSIDGHRPSTGLIETLNEARGRGLLVLGLVGPDAACLPLIDEAVLVPPLDGGLAFQSVIWHCLLSHPDVKIRQLKQGWNRSAA